MTKWATTLFILLGIAASLTVAGRYLQISQSPEIGNSAVPVAAAPAPALVANTDKAEIHTKACLAAADKSREVSWEISCEQLNESSAQAYNACVTAHALANKSASIERECQTNCILPREVAKKIIQTRDDAKAACLKNK